MTTGRPGDVLLDRYLPEAGAAEREEARKDFRRLAVLLVEIGRRLREEQRQATDSTEWPRRHTIPPFPPS